MFYIISVQARTGKHFVRVTGMTDVVANQLALSPLVEAVTQDYHVYLDEYDNTPEAVAAWRKLLLHLYELKTIIKLINQAVKRMFYCVDTSLLIPSGRYITDATSIVLLCL